MIMDDESVIIENVEIEFFHGIEQDGDYYTTSFIYPPCGFFSRNMVTVANTKYHKNSVVVRCKDGEVVNTHPLHWKTMKVPVRATVKFTMYQDKTLFAHNIEITDVDMSIVAGGPLVYGGTRPGELTREERHEINGFNQYYVIPRYRSVSPVIHNRKR